MNTSSPTRSVTAERRALAHKNVAAFAEYASDKLPPHIAEDLRIVCNDAARAASPEHSPDRAASEPTHRMAKIMGCEFVLKVSEAMIEAGVEAMDKPTEKPYAEGLVEAIYLAMETARSKPKQRYIEEGVHGYYDQNGPGR